MEILPYIITGLGGGVIGLLVASFILLPQYRDLKARHEISCDRNAKLEKDNLQNAEKADLCDRTVSKCKLLIDFIQQLKDVGQFRDKGKLMTVGKFPPQIQTQLNSILKSRL